MRLNGRSPADANGEASGNVVQAIQQNSSPGNNCKRLTQELDGLVATLYPPERKTGIPYSDSYAVSFDGERIIEHSRDPEPELARALLARGITGSIKIIDANTGAHRSTVNIEAAARITVLEGRSVGPRFVKWRPMPQIGRESCAGRPPSPETTFPGAKHCHPSRRAWR